MKPDSVGFDCDSCLWSAHQLYHWEDLGELAENVSITPVRLPCEVLAAYGFAKLVHEAPSALNAYEGSHKSSTFPSLTSPMV